MSAEGSGQRRNGVLRGREGWLYWVGRAGEVPALYADTPATRRCLAAWERRIDRRIARAAHLGIRYVQMIVPEKLAVHDEGLAAPIPGLDDPPATRLGRAVATRHPGVMVPLLGPLRAARGEGDVYLRTDTHWTHRGYAVAYRALCAALGAAPVAHVLHGATVPDRFTFDLGEKLDPPIPEDYLAYDFARRARRTQANALVRLRESGEAKRPSGIFVGSRVVMENPAATDRRRVVLFGDSYVFDQGPRLTAMLAETFAEVHAVWSASVDWRLVEAVKPDIIIHEIAERFLRRVPNDRIRIDAVAERRAATALGLSPLARLRRRWTGTAP